MTIVLLNSKGEVLIYRSYEHLLIRNVDIISTIDTKKISSNDNYCLILDHENNAWMSDVKSNSKCACNKIDIKNIIEIVAGYDNQLALLDVSGKVWMFKDENWQEVEGLSKIKRVVSHCQALYFQDHDNNFWVLGKTPFNKDVKNNVPFKLSTNYEIKDIGSGRSSYLFFTDKDDNVYIVKESGYPIPTDFPKAKKMLTHDFWSAILDYNGDVWLKGQSFFEYTKELVKINEKYIVDIKGFMGSLFMIDIDGNLCKYGSIDYLPFLDEEQEKKEFIFGNLLAWDEPEISLKSARK